MKLTAKSPCDEAAYLGRMADRAAEYTRLSKASSTVKAYRSDWEDFENWCRKHGQNALPASVETLVLYLSDLAGDHKPSTLNRRIASISVAHKAEGHETPTRDDKVRRLMAGIRRVQGARRNAKSPILADTLKEMVACSPETILGGRNRAVLLIGFAGAFRRSELVSLDVDAVEVTRDGLVVSIRRSKTDQEGRGRQVGIPYGSSPNTCPVQAYLAWLRISGITKGPIFRPITRHGRILPQRLSTNAVAEIVKRYAKAVGLDAACFAGHSLRSGLATSAARAGASERAIANQTGHRSVVMLRRYIQAGSLFRDNVVAGLGL